jgi:ribonuclease VapC
VTVCLDAWAALRWLDGREPSATDVEGALEEGIVMSWINLGEIFYILSRRAGSQRADEAVRALRARVMAETPSPHRVLEAAAIKARHRMSYADAFAVATASAHRATLMTGDPEILAVPHLCEMRDLR